MTTMANLVRIIGVVAVFVSIPLTLRAAGDYFSPGSSPEMNSRPNVTSEEVFLKDMGWLPVHYVPPTLDRPSTSSYNEMKNLLGMNDKESSEKANTERAAMEARVHEAEAHFKEAKKEQDETFTRLREQRIASIRARALKSFIAYGVLLAMALVMVIRPLKIPTSN